MQYDFLKDDYLVKIALQTDSNYVKLAKDLIVFVIDIYRNLEPSHFNGKLVVFFEKEDSQDFQPSTSEKFYDKGMLNDAYHSIVFQLFQNGKFPHIWTNVDTDSIDTLLSSNDFIAYIYENEQEYFIVNQHRINIVNSYSCPSIFALQYHDLNEALLTYKNERIRSSSCELFKNCWADGKRIYFKNKPEDCMQMSLNEFLKNRLRGVDIIVREYTLGASKPVDVRVYWNEANRAALIEVKWLGRSVKDNGELSTSYSNSRANDGMQQIKDYLDLENSDTPMVITKGYLIVVDGRRKGIHTNKVSQISLKNGMAYENTELNIAEDKKYWETYKNIEKPIRMFAEPICEK